MPDISVTIMRQSQEPKIPNIVAREYRMTTAHVLRHIPATCMRTPGKFWPKFRPEFLRDMQMYRKYQFSVKIVVTLRIFSLVCVSN